MILGRFLSQFGIDMSFSHKTKAKINKEMKSETYSFEKKRWSQNR